MNLTLLRKELCGLGLCVVLILAINAIDLVFRCVSGFPDRPEEEAMDSGVADIVLSSLIYGILVGLAVFGQEREHRTLSFLDGLPVSRFSFFLHKFLAGLLVIFGIHLFDSFYIWFFDWLTENSLSDPTPVAERWAGFAVQAVLTLTIAGVAAFLSFSRKWFPLLAGLAVSIMVWIRLKGGPLGDWFDTTTLVSPTLVDNAIAWPSRQILGHLILGALGWLCSYLAFQYRDGLVSRTVDRLAAVRGAGCLTMMGQLLAVCVWIGVMVSLADDEKDSDQPIASRAAGEINFDTLGEDSKDEQDLDERLEDAPQRQPAGVPVSFSSQRTEHFEIIFRESKRERVLSLYDSLDRVHEQVVRYFQFPPRVRGRIVVDTGSRVLSHTAGITNWTKIRVPLSDDVDDARFLQTLRHEVAHVYIEQLSDGQTAGYFNTLRLFHEGVASAVELYPVEDDLDKERRQMELWAVGTDSRGRLPLAELCDDETLKNSRHEYVVYPLGYIVALALVEVGGHDLPRRMMETLRTAKLPIGARPIEIWQGLLQRNDCSLEMLVAAYESRLDELREREADFLAGIPQIQGKVTVEEDQIVIRASTERSATSDWIIAMVQSDAVLMNEWQIVPEVGDNEFRIPRASHSGNRIRYILGWQTPEATGPIFEPWVEATLAP